MAFAKDYNSELQQGLRLSGESKLYFAEARIKYLRTIMQIRFTPTRILDFGCGLGETSQILSKTFPSSEIVGLEPDAILCSRARETISTAQITFVSSFPQIDRHRFDLCYCNGVFHHLSDNDRINALANIHRSLMPEGYFALFENNPWNPGTKLVMRSIPFDRDARCISPGNCKRLLLQNKFTIVNKPRYLFFLPHFLAFIRGVEKHLVSVPLGAQYLVLSKPDLSH
jgi:SAM-dependent methyltransferase